MYDSIFVSFFNLLVPIYLVSLLDRPLFVLSDLAPIVVFFSFLSCFVYSNFFLCVSRMLTSKLLANEMVMERPSSG